MPSSHYRYLNSGDAPRLTSFLAQRVHEQQARAPASQWTNIIRGLTQKGVKQREIDESGIMGWLESQGNHPVTRDSILEQLALRPTIKEIDLATPVYERYVQSGFDSYRETLYCLNSPRNNVEDRLEEIRFELEDLDFNPEKLLQQPQLVFQLDSERRTLIDRRGKLPDFKHHHFSGVEDPTTGTKVKNLIAHTRTSRRGPVLFIDEIQSDWAQRRRRFGESDAIPDGPFINNTEVWAGMVLRRVMQRAAEDETVSGVAWINANLRNGGMRQSDGLDEFYLRVLPGLANKALKGTGVTVKSEPVEIGNGATHDLPYVPITDAVRAKLLNPQPLYSLDLMPKAALALEQDMHHVDMLREAREMLGSTVSVRLVGRVLRTAEGVEEEAAARQIAHLIEISSRARSAARSFNHEAFHYAMTHLMTDSEVQVLRNAFADGGKLNGQVRRAMVAARMSPEAVAQCSNPDEAVAHAFSLWREQRLSFDEREGYAGSTGLDRTVGRIFRKIERAFDALGQWVRRVVGETPQRHAARMSERLFEALRDGVLSRRHASRPDNHPEFESVDSGAPKTTAPNSRPRPH